MIFDAYAFVEKLESEVGQAATPATFATQHPKSRANVADVADVAGRQGQEPENTPSAKPPDNPCDYPYGRAVAGGPKTWTGKVVSLDAWRDLSEWERHGSTGKQWNGLTRQWEPKP